MPDHFTPYAHGFFKATEEALKKPPHQQEGVAAALSDHCWPKNIPLEKMLQCVRKLVNAADGDTAAW